MVFQFLDIQEYPNDKPLGINIPSTKLCDATGFEFVYLKKTLNQIYQNILNAKSQ